MKLLWGPHSLRMELRHHDMEIGLHDEQSNQTACNDWFYCNVLIIIWFELKISSELSKIFRSQ